MPTRQMRRSERLAGLALLGVATFVLTAWAGQTMPPAATPIPTATSLPLPLGGTLVISGRGASALQALEASRARTTGLGVPERLPPGFSLALSETRIQPDGAWASDSVYLAADARQLQIFQSSYPNRKQVLAPVESSGTVSIAGETWRHLVLAYPQPDRTLLRIVFMDWSDGQSYRSLSVDSRGAPQVELVNLIEVASSLR